jgi:hypothetical protein
MNALQTLLSKGQSYNVLKALQPILQGTDEGKTLILLMARWNGNENDYNTGGLSIDYYKMEVARINKSILALMEQLEDVSPTDRQFAVAQQAKETIQQIHHTYHHSVVQHHTGKGDNVAGNKVTGNDNIVISGVTGSQISIGRTDLDRNPKPSENLKASSTEQIFKLIDEDIDAAFDKLDEIFLHKNAHYLDLSKEYSEQPTHFSISNFRSRLKRFVKLNIK